jgi:pimeloyl-ACP methyl ester carboxylesterase
MPLVGTRYYFPHALVDEFARDHTATTLRGLELPVLAYQGSRDKLVDLAPLRRIASEREGIEIRVVPGAGHGFLLWRRWIVRQTVRWAAQRLRR